MAKFKPGIPDTFDITIGPVQDLGDYLDEPSPMPVRKPKPQKMEVGEGTDHATAALPPEAVPPVGPVSRQPLPPQPAVVHADKRTTAITPKPSTTELTSAALPAPIILRQERVIPSALTGTAPVRESAINDDWVPKPKAPRREISMTPEAFRMSEELLEVIRNGSGQRDTAAKELVHALILLAHEVIDEIDPHSIPKRGRWGTPTARAYPLELKNAILKALRRKHTSGLEERATVSYPMNEGRSVEYASGHKTSS
ncbi:MAG: hypothetical protein ABS79_03620 [Planctomycetes bacterium SCN 63-9]|nr:MAG: hypothetical protein ABS79_03620 [Planctomycetes bacterium SCN 63-9]